MVSIPRIIIHCQISRGHTKHTRIKFESLTDIDMIMFIERGDLNQYSGRYPQANDKYMRTIC